MTIAVLTTAIPERLRLLADNITSVAAQTRPPDLHLIGIDHAHTGLVPNLNALAQEADARGIEWLAPLADDDTADPHHLETLAAHTSNADIVYTWCRVEGREWNPNRAFDPGALRAGNYIPSTALIRTELARDLGWWRPVSFEDWDFWLRALDAGARFHCEPVVTWTYRFHGGNRTLGAAA